jgi:hypothetical protein
VNSYGNTANILESMWDGSTVMSGTRECSCMIHQSLQIRSRSLRLGSAVHVLRAALALAFESASWQAS